MGSREEEFLKRLKATFRIEAEEHLQAMSTGLMELEQLPAGEQTALVEVIFREAHSLKGAARAVDLTEIEAVCQPMESVLAAWKREQLQPSPVLFDVLHSSVELLEALLASEDDEQNALAERVTQVAKSLNQVLKGEVVTSSSTAATSAVETVVEPATEEQSRVAKPAKIEAAPNAQTNGAASYPVQSSVAPEVAPTETANIVTQNETPPIVAPKVEQPATKAESPVPKKTSVKTINRDSGHAETVRITTSKLDSLMRQVEELLAIKLTLAQRAVELRDIREFVDEYSRSIVKAQRGSRLRRAGRDWRETNDDTSSPENNAALTEFMEQNRRTMRTLDGKLNTLGRAAEHDRRSVGGMIDNLLEDIKKVLMLPLSSLLEQMPKMVRDLARSQSKEIQLQIEGGDIEVDRRILEEMKDPLVHLLRNSIDHGLEEPAERERNGKPRHGTISIQVSPRDGSNVEILIHDDGHGINVAKVKKSALRLGHITEEQALEMPDSEAVMLIFQSELSTSSIITDISGRGLGMAIVREKVEKLGGRIAVETESGKGTTFRILLPLTLATFRGVLVKAGGRPFVIPTINVERVVQISPSQIKTICGRQTISLEDRTLSLVSLAQVLELPSSQTNGDILTTVVLGTADKRIAFLVDAVLDEQEVLVKSLGKQLMRVRNIAAATVLGSGEIVPILNVPDLLKSATSIASQIVSPSQSGAETARQSILIAEDSITSRMLIKNILESAGYRVKATVDGMEAFAALQDEPFDLVVSDVEMPRLSGFELTEKIRSTRELAEMPVVLVTSLGSREHQEKGIEVGANAYIIKSKFDQNNLLEVVRRLI